MSSFHFKTTFAEDIFRAKYAQGPSDTWPNLCRRLVNDVCGDRSLCAKPTTYSLMSKADQDQLVQYMIEMKVIAAGRYLYYAGRPLSFFNNCMCLGVEDTREGWADLAQRAMSCLMSGGGIGVCYDNIRPAGRVLSRTGGIASGPLPLMKIINEIGRGVMQGGSRRSAMLASLNWQHDDIQDFITVKNWSEDMKRIKAEQFDFPLPLDMTNISVNFDTSFLELSQAGQVPALWDTVVKQMCQTGEPGMCFNFYENEKEVYTNACSEFKSDTSDDICNLSSINLAAISSKEELKDVVRLASMFLICGTLRADVPYERIKEVREKNRNIGLGLMGVHEWLLQRGYDYEVTEELKSWLEVYRDESERAAREHCDRFYISHPKKFRAIAPAGTIGILA